MLLQVVIAAVFLLSLLGLLLFIWPRRQRLRGILAGGAASYVGGDYTGGEGYSPHDSGGAGGGADGEVAAADDTALFGRNPPAMRPSGSPLSSKGT